MNKCRYLYLFLVFLLLTQALVSQQNRSQNLEGKLVSDGFTVTKQLLSGSLSEEFPYNIVISLPSTLEYPLYRFFIVVSQENAQMYYSEVTQLIRLMQERPASYPVEIVLCANNESPHTSLSNSLSGIKTYIQHLESVSYTTSVELLFTQQNSDRKTVVEIGTKGRVSPSSFVDALLRSLEASQTEFTIKGRFNSLYRMGFVSVSPVVSYMINQEIPSAALCIDPSSIKNIAQALSFFTGNTKPPDVDNWDNNYTLLQVFGKRLIVPEYILMMVIIGVSGVSLFFLCSFSFLVGKATMLRKEELSRTWYLLPIIIGITALFLHLAQQLTLVIFPSWQYNDITALIIKLAFGLVFLSFVSLAQYLFSFPLTSFIYGYLLLIVVFINIFIFTTADISLFIPFSAEYLIVYATRSSKKKRGILISAVLMTLPFLPYAVLLDTDTRNNLLRAFFNTNLLGNILFACFAVPFEIMWIRIMVRMKLFGKQKGVSLKQILIELGGTALIVILISLSVSIVRAKTTNEFRNSEQKNIIQTSSYSYTAAEVERSVLFNKAAAKVTVSSSLPVVRYNLHIQSESPLPIYDANYPYDSLSIEGSAVFTLDDYPPNPLQLRFSSPADFDSELVITAYILHGSTIIEEKKSIFFKKEQ